MPALIVLLLVALIGLGFLNSVLWVVAAVLVFGLMHYGRGTAGRDGLGADADYREYRDRRDRWDRRYRRQRQSRWNRQARRDEQNRE